MWSLAFALISMGLEEGASALPVDVEPVVVASGLRHPWSVAFLPTGDYLVSEKEGGLVRIAADGTSTPISGMPRDMETNRQNRGDNSGLFEVVLDPEFANNDRLFMAYAARDGDGATTTRLISARLTDDRLTDVETLFEATPFTAERFHYGGALLIVEDHLYLTVGERHFHERDNPPFPAAQNPLDRRGKIYRFTLDGAAATDNPDFGPGAPAGVYASGIRASQGMAWDSARRTIWFTDHGPTGGDELNRLVPGANYGWPVRTGGRYRNEDYAPAQTLPATTTYTEPVHIWSDQTVAPTGLTISDSDQFPEWKGDLIVGGLSRGYLMRVDLEGDRVAGIQYLMTDAPVRIRNVSQSPDGDLYAVTDEADGRLLRLQRRQ